MVEVAAHLKGRDFTRIGSWSSEELKTVLDLADELKELQARREPHELLPGRMVGLIFQKPSTRTRVSFEVGIAQLGGRGFYLAAGDLQLGRGETIKDTATVLERYLDAIMIRTFAQEDVEQLAEYADIPVINGLTDYSHPCQALADLMTIRERLGRLSGVRARLPRGREQRVHLAHGRRRPLRDALRRRDAGGLRAGRRRSHRSPPSRRADGRDRRAVRDPLEAAREADVLYTDVWTSMGQEEESERRRADLAEYRIDDDAPRAGRRRRDRPPLSACPLRRRDHRGGALRPAVGGLGPGREPAPLPEGAARADRSRVSRSRTTSRRGRFRS